MTVYASTGREKVIDSTAVLRGAMRLINEATVSGGAVTSFTVSGLDLDTHQTYYLEYCIDNVSVSTTVLSMYISGDTTAANYDSEITGGAGSTTASAGANSAQIHNSMSTTRQMTGVAHMQLDIDGKMTVVGHYVDTETTTRLHQMFGVKARNAGNVTSITISSSVASAINNGSYLRVYAISGTADTAQADDINYDNATSGLTAANVQDAIDELASPIRAVQAADLVITSNNVLQDTDLVVPLTAGTWLIEAEYWVLSHATPDMEVTPTYTGTITSVRHNRMSANGGGTFPIPSTATSLTAANYTTTEVFFARHQIHIAVSDSGNFKYQARQVTSSATSVTFYKGATIRATRLA